MKIVLAPCMGVGQIVAGVTRRAAYLVHRKYPERTALLSLPALMTGETAQRELVQNNPVIYIDGCGQRCAAHIFHHMGIHPAAKIEVGQVMAEAKLGPGKTRQQLDEIGRKLAEIVVERLERILHNEALFENFKPVERINLNPPKPECAHACSCLPPRELIAPVSGQPPKHVTVFPCQGIRRSGGRVTQRAAYQLVEDRFPGQTLLLCVPALAAGVPEDVEMLEQFPTVAVNGCSQRCASVDASRHGVPAAVSIDLDIVAPEYPGKEVCTRPDLTGAEEAAARTLTDACVPVIRDLLAGKIPWQPGKCSLLGMVNQPAAINEAAGYHKHPDGYMTREEA